MKKSSKPKVQKLPRKCECGGNMEYSESFGRVFSGCDRCTPVVKVVISR